MTEEAGHGGSLIKELRLLKSVASKPSSSALLDKDGRLLTSDTKKLSRWAEHFSLVMNCGKVVRESVLHSLPTVVPLNGDSVALTEQLCCPPSEGEIGLALSRLKYEEGTRC